MPIGINIIDGDIGTLGQVPVSQGDGTVIWGSPGGGGETVVELGTVTFTDVNANPTDADYNLTTNQAPANSYVTGFIFKVTADFVNPGGDKLDIVQMGAGYLNLPSPAYIQTISNQWIPTLTLDTGQAAYTMNATLDTVDNGGAPIANPQDFTDGSVTIYGIFKSFP